MGHEQFDVVQQRHRNTLPPQTHTRSRHRQGNNSAREALPHFARCLLRVLAISDAMRDMSMPRSASAAITSITCRQKGRSTNGGRRVVAVRRL